eukprot:COSAG02_NODE_3553_length_6571_cov_3.989957_1_plen_26_part_10
MTGLFSQSKFGLYTSTRVLKSDLALQ